MTEQYPTDAELNALSGTTDPEQDVPYPTIGESPYYTSFYKMLYRLLDVVRRAGDLRVYKEGDLTYGVRAGEFVNGDTPVSYEGSNENALTNNASNYIYLTYDGTLTVNTTGFPDPSDVPHVPLASIETSEGQYGLDDVTDYRARAIFALLRGSACRWRGQSASEPDNPIDGDIYKNSSDSNVYLYDGEGWIALT